MRVLVLLLRPVYLDVVDALHHTIEDQAPTENAEGKGRHLHGLHQHEDSYTEDDGGEEPEDERYGTDFTDGSEVEILVDGAENQDGRQHIHHSTDKCGGHQGEDNTQYHAAQTHDRERGHDGSLNVLRVLWCIVAITHLGHGSQTLGCLYRLALFCIVGNDGYQTGNEEQGTCGDGQPLNHFCAVDYQQVAYDNRADGADDGTLEYSHSFVVFRKITKNERKKQFFYYFCRKFLRNDAIITGETWRDG